MKITSRLSKMIITKIKIIRKRRTSRLSMISKQEVSWRNLTQPRFRRVTLRRESLQMQFVGSCIFFSSRNSVSANCKLLYSGVKRYLTFSEPFSRFFSKCLTCFSILLTFAILSFFGGSRGLCARNKNDYCFFLDRR